MKLFILIILIFAFASTEDDDKLSKSIETAAVASGHPEIAAAIEILKNFKTESSTVMGPKQDQVGFKYFHNVHDHGYGSVNLNKLDQLIKLWLDDETFDFLSDTYKKILSSATKEYSLQVFEDVYHKQKFNLFFNDGKGSLFMLMLTLSPHPTLSNVVKWEKFLIQTNFEPAPSYIIVTTSDCNILSCDRSDEIVYMPVVMTNEHIDNIIKLNIDIINFFVNVIK